MTEHLQETGAVVVDGTVVMYVEHHDIFEIAPSKGAAVEAAEEKLSAYIAAHYGDQWGETDEIEVEKLQVELVEQYEIAGTPIEQRRRDV